MLRISSNLVFLLCVSWLCVLCDIVVRSSFAQEPDRSAIRKKLELAMGPLPGDKRKLPLDVQILEVTKLDKFTRIKLTYAAEKNDRVPAYLLIPNERKGRLPAVLC